MPARTRSIARFQTLLAAFLLINSLIINPILAQITPSVTAPKPLTVALLNLPVIAPDSLPIQRLVAAVQALQEGPLVRYGTVAMSVRRVRDGVELAGFNARQSVQTASTLKLVTTATALAVLGPGFRYTTFLEHDGSVRDSLLTGNLIVRGTGDPSLGSGRFGVTADWPTLLSIWAVAVRQAGIRRISGAVVGDASLYDDLTTPDTWPWGDLGNYYGASLSALSVNENLYKAVFRPGKTVGSAATLLRTEPALPYLTMTNRVTTDAANTDDQTNLYAAPFGNTVFLTGKVPLGRIEFPVKGALPDPAYSVAFSLAQRLTQDSVRIGTPPLTYRAGFPAPANAPRRTVLMQVQSPPLAELIQQTNFQSLNSYAEALLRTAASRLAKRAVNNDESVEEVEKYWQSRGVNMGGFRMRDGSGLSTTGAVTASTLTGILATMSRDAAFPVFYESIPVVGQSGTVRNLGKDTPAFGNVRAKSGTLEGVKAYAGYATARNGELVSFALLVNRYTPGEGVSSAVTAQLARIMGLLPGL
jgi:serine-type D-Ala-D-Ala carboxypeptidase/endopeptidase (penicillin-binding protein 4)